MEKVSVVIPFYNCKYVDKAIRSVCNQTYPNIEIIVVDDGSTKFKNKPSPFLNQIKLIKKKRNEGTASALNQGIKQATGDYIAWLSSDDIYKPRKIEHQLSHLKKVGGEIGYTSFRFMNEHGEMLSRIIGRSFNKKDFYKRMQQGSVVNGSTTLISRKVFDKIGLFDENLKFASDYDFWLRVMGNFEFYFLDSPLVYYRVHEQMSTKKYSSNVQEEKKMVQQKYRRKLKELIVKQKRK